MIFTEVHSVRAREQRLHPEISTCCECHRSFRARTEDQFSLGLCDTCFDEVRHLREQVIRIHVKPRSPKPTAL